MQASEVAQTNLLLLSYLQTVNHFEKQCDVQVELEFTLKMELRLIAAAGIFCLRQSSEIDVTSSLAEEHGLSQLKTEDPRVYYLYNTGSEYELKDSENGLRAFVLPTWRLHHQDLLYNRDPRKRGAYNVYRAGVVS